MNIFAVCTSGAPYNCQRLRGMILDPSHDPQLAASALKGGCPPRSSLFPLPSAAGIDASVSASWLYRQTFEWLG